jgi:uncharacterized protein (TIGR02594 family)
MTTLAIQTALKAKGFDPGPLDGAMGPLTRNAVRAFERAHALKPDGMPDPAFLRALLGDAGSDVTLLPWFAEAERRMGLNEMRDKAALSAFLQSDGASVGDPAKLPWCGDFVETCIALTLPDEPLPANPYLARNWLKFGVACAPAEGAVLVFWRGVRNGTSGHVGFCAGEDAGAYHVLGGNQANAVSVARVAKARLLGARWPRTAAAPAGVSAGLAAARGALSTDEQ